MFTLKLYSNEFDTQSIVEAESFFVKRHPKFIELRAYHKNRDGYTTYAIGCLKNDELPDTSSPADGGNWNKAIIENSSGKTTEII